MFGQILQVMEPNLPSHVTAFQRGKQSEDTQRVNRAARQNNNPAGRDNAVFCGEHVTLRQSYTTTPLCVAGKDRLSSRFCQLEK